MRSAASAPVPLWQRVMMATERGPPDRSLKRGSLTQVQLTNREVRHLRAFARAFLANEVDYGKLVGVPNAGAVALTQPYDEAGETLRCLLLEPFDPDTERGRAALRLGVRLGLVSPLDAEMLPSLVRHFGRSLLEDTTVIYNGHATTAAAGVFPMLAAFGLRDAAFALSSYSGEPGVARLFNAFLAHLQRNGAEEFDLAAHGEARAALLSRLMDSNSGPVVLVNVGTLLLAGDVPEEVRARIDAGEIRFVQHNAADITALRALGPNAVIIDAAGSELKELEASVIGEQYAVLAAKASLDVHDAPLRESALIVKGAGLIGGGIIAGALRLGLAPERIVVIDRDPAALAAARALGLERVHEREPEELKHEPHGVVIIATDDVGLDGNTIEAYPHSIAVMAATSGGQGVNLASIRERFVDAYAVDHALPIAAYMLSQTHPSHALVFGPRGPKCEQFVHVLNCRSDRSTGKAKACPPNLARPLYQERLATAVMIAVAVAQARQTSHPGEHRLDPDLQAIIRRAFAQLRLNDAATPTIRGVSPERVTEILASLKAAPERRC